MTVGPHSTLGTHSLYTIGAYVRRRAGDHEPSWHPASICGCGVHVHGCIGNTLLPWLSPQPRHLPFSADDGQANRIMLDRPVNEAGRETMYRAYVMFHVPPLMFLFPRQDAESRGRKQVACAQNTWTRRTLRCGCVEGWF